LYADYERCRQRAYRRKVEAEAQDRGVVTTPSLAAMRETAPSITGTGSRNGDAQIARKAPRRRHPSDVRVSLPRLERVAREVLSEAKARELLVALRLGGKAARR